MRYLPLTDQQHDLLLDGLAQRRPALDEQLQLRVQRAVFCINCAAYCAALHRGFTLSRGLIPLFDSPRGYLLLLHRIASGRNSRYTLREP